MKIVFFLFSLLLGLTSSAQILKSYSGEYDAPHKDPLIRFGKATYTYYQGNEGRIYHGKFNYNDRKNIITGDFVNNVQNGLWIYQTSNVYGKYTYSINFKDGMLNGLFSMTLTNPKTNAIITKITCNFLEGRLVGNVSGTNVKLSVIGDLSTIKKNTFKGKFDDESFPEGKWILNGNSRQWTENYCGNDTCVVTYINLSTGDIIKPSYESEQTPRLPNLIIKEVNSLLEIILMRGSEQKLLTEFNFDTPRIVHEYTDGKIHYSITTDNPSSRVFIITYPHHYSDLIPHEFGNEIPVYQEIPKDALRPPKEYNPSIYIVPTID